MTLIDITRTLDARLAVWPGDAPFELHVICDRRLAAPVNLTRLTLSAHLGTHIDAPHHIADAAQTVDALDLAIYWGLAQVVTVDKTAGPLIPDDFAGVALERAPRLLVRSTASLADPTIFLQQFVYPSPELADYLAAQGILLYGTDAPSMDAAESEDLAGHLALLRNGIAILEGLELSQAADGVYDFVALPLKIAGGDGSPVRAALRSLSLSKGL